MGDGSVCNRYHTAYVEGKNRMKDVQLSFGVSSTDQLPR